MSIPNPARRGTARPLPFAEIAFSLLLVFGSAFPLPATAGPYVVPGHAATSMAAWADAVDGVARGPQNISVPAGPLASAGSEANVLGPATGSPSDTLSLGDGGSITVFFDSGISNGPGDDFAVFENGFFDLFGLFAELAFVSVASDGVAFAQFESHTFNGFSVGPFDSLDETDYHGLAGLHAAMLGTGFDLADLAFDPLVQAGDVNLTDIRYIRLTDVVGDGSTYDSFANPIYDPFATSFPTGGFDLEAVGVIHVPEPNAMLGLSLCLLVFASLAIRRRASSRILLSVFSSLAIVSPGFAMTADFENLGLVAGTYENGAGLAGGDLSSGGITFENNYFSSYDGFDGFVASATTDVTTPGYGNQYSSITGGGRGGSAAYGVYFPGYSDPRARVVMPSATIVDGAYFTNATYGYLSMRDGDSFAKAFGGVSGDDPDYLELSIQGIDATGTATGSVEFLLADYRFADNGQDYLVDDWTWVDLSGLGPVKELAFSFTSTDVGSFGINTPQYFAIDDLTTIPEPGTAILLGLGLAGLAHRRARG